MIFRTCGGAAARVACARAGKRNHARKNRADQRQENDRLK
jgi:hypothetical protein